MLFGVVAGGWQLARSALTAERLRKAGGPEREFYEAKLLTALANEKVNAGDPVTGVLLADEAYANLLDKGADADRAEIQAAYKRLMRAVHPDSGGTAGLAAQLNAARDRLLRK